MIYEFDQAISKMDEFRAEAQVLIPVLKAARAELGEERADRLALGALRAWLREGYQRRGAPIPGSPKEKFDALWEMGVSRIEEDDLEIVTLKQEPGTQESDVTRCRYAEFFHQLGEPELGAVLVCDSDIYLVEEVTSPEVEYTRTQSIMEGASFCDIRWRIKTSSIPK